MKDSLEILDIGIANLEKTYTAFRAFRQLTSEIVSFEQEVENARSAAAAAQKGLADLNQQVAVAQSQLDKVQAERAQTESAWLS